MDHAPAVMEGDSATVAQKPSADVSNVQHEARANSGLSPSPHANDQRKRKANFNDDRIRHGSQGGRGGRGNGKRSDKRHKKGDMGRGEYFRDQPDKRQKNKESQDKRDAGSGPMYGKQFSQEEIDSDEKKPKRKVAVLIGYSGTGYKGMQISPSEKTIEGDLFDAFIAAGAISKANANDPKKVSLVRCARTDKGVHAAGNMISLKLIVEDNNIVEKINSNLSPQIRVWGIERTIGSFSCYQACDSRWYEYLIPSHAFLPPHPSSWLAKKLEELADHADDRTGYDLRQEEVKGYWDKVEESKIRPIIDAIDEDIRRDVVKALQGEDESSAKAATVGVDVDTALPDDNDVDGQQDLGDAHYERTADAPDIVNSSDAQSAGRLDDAEAVSSLSEAGKSPSGILGTKEVSAHAQGDAGAAETSRMFEGTPEQPTGQIDPGRTPGLMPPHEDRQVRLRAATKRLRNAYIDAKRRWRICERRVKRIQSVLDQFVGTMNFHNYTVQKRFQDPSAKRHIRSFVVNPEPVLIGEGADEEKSEWLSLKIHGQSFMMHQIRKMIGMVTLIVRCGSDPSTLTASLQDARYSIPKVPGLGLLLERPVFDSYNNIQALKHGRERLDFSKFEQELESFKDREIYQRIFREEEERNEFGRFFNHVDNFKEPCFLYLASKGYDTTKKGERKLGATPS